MDNWDWAFFFWASFKWPLGYVGLWCTDLATLSWMRQQGP